jgi:hypothetical protein
MPRGYSALLWGEKKSGKSVLGYDASGMICKHHPNKDSLIIKFDSEMRDRVQLTPEMAKGYGIEFERFIVYEVNRPEDIFDRMKNEVKALIDDGAEIPLIIIDSISDILGRRESDQDSVTQHQIGDHAVTLQVGLKSILQTQRSKKIGLFMIAHARDEMDQWEIKRGNKKKPAAANAVQHHCEYFINVEKNKTASGKADILERKFLDDSKKDMKDNGQQTAHRTYVWMQDSSLGPKNRETEFTFADGKGIINQHEEVFRLGLNWKVIERPCKGQYVIGDQKFIGKPACLEALEKNVDLQQKVVSRLIEMDKPGLSMTLGTVCEDVEDE